ncbi:MAG: hypothetical protein HXY38_09995 [Chloroflexi bacterium]|nr:hypothetical protein [Chloroflexota bacterium]
MNLKDNPSVPTLDKRLPIAWFLGIPLAYVVVSYLENFYQTAFLVALWTIAIHSLANLLMYYLMSRLARDVQRDRWFAGISGILFAALIVFVPAMYFMAKPFTNLFDASAFHLDASVRVSFLNALIPPFFIAMVVVNVARQRKWHKARLLKMLDENLDALLLSFLFFCVYLLFASIFNRPSYDADDIFFDADGNLYRWRYATADYRDYYWRPAHPFILIIIRPLVGLLAFLFRGDTLFAAFTLNALTGALGVFLVWYFVKHSIGNRLYALLIAALFGASASQLVFGSIIESYIYLSAAALIFLILLLKDAPLWAQVIAGLTAFGITISNIGQTFIVHFFVKLNLKQIVIYGLIVGALVAPLSLLNNYMYPEANPYFWDLSTLQGEGHNQFPATLQRAEYLARVMAFHSFIAPEPLVIRDGWPFPKIWMFRASIKKDPMQLANYETLLGDGLVVLWSGFLLAGAVFFLKTVIRKYYDGYSIAFIVTLLFYFALHLRYGKDVFLYSTNWTYAIALFLALAWRELAGRRWFQVFLLVFILLLLVNNAGLYKTMMEISAPSVQYPIWR